MRAGARTGSRAIIAHRRADRQTRRRAMIARLPIMKPSASLLSLGVAVLLSACGFRLVGHAPLPKQLEMTYVDAQDRQTDFAQGLRKALLTAGAQVADDGAKATAVVHLLQDVVTPRVLAVSSENLPREYEITYTVRFSVSSGTKELLPPQEVSL